MSYKMAGIDVNKKVLMVVVISRLQMVTSAHSAFFVKAGQAECPLAIDSIGDSIGGTDSYRRKQKLPKAFVASTLFQIFETFSSPRSLT